MSSAVSLRLKISKSNIAGTIPLIVEDPGKLIRLNSHAKFQGDLVMRDFAVHNVTARVDYFEPFQMVQGLLHSASAFLIASSMLFGDDPITSIFLYV